MMKKSRPSAFHPALPKAQAFLPVFESLWKDLFTSPVHLDSALSKRPDRFKSVLAQIVPQILLRPVSLAEALGIGVAPGEPWSLKREQLANWRPAFLMAERLYDLLAAGGVDIAPVLEDFPPSMIEEWEKSWGKAGTAELAKTLATEAPLSLRASPRIGAEGLLKELKKGSGLPVRVSLSDVSPLGVSLEGYAPVMKLPVYEKGLFEIQDEGSQLMALFALWPEKFGKMLSKKPGAVKAAPVSVPDKLPEWPKAASLVDACAGAGGKTLAWADMLGGSKGRIFAYDTSEKKLQALRRRATRGGYRNIQAVAVTEGQEITALEKFRGKAQLVLVDAPCSGWGVLRRNPDIKWRQGADTLERMPGIQSRLLTQYSELVAPGGILVFGVCTFRREESTDIVSEFLASNRGFTKMVEGYLGPGPSDGFFMAALKRD